MADRKQAAIDAMAAAMQARVHVPGEDPWRENAEVALAAAWPHILAAFADYDAAYVQACVAHANVMDPARTAWHCARRAADGGPLNPADLTAYHQAAEDAQAAFDAIEQPARTALEAVPS